MNVEILSKNLQKLHIGLVLGLVVIGSMLLVIVAITIAFSVEISRLKSSNSGPDQQNLSGLMTRSSSLHFHSKKQVANSDNEGIMQALASISSSFDSLSQQFLEVISAVEDRTQLLDSTLEILSQRLFQGTSAFERIISASEQLENSIQQISGSVSQSVTNAQEIVQQILASNNADSSLDAISQQLLQEISTLENSIQEVDSTISLQVNSALDGARQIASDIEALGIFEAFPAPSCAAINPALSSGFFLVRSSDNSGVRVYCDMDLSCGGLTGGWQRLVDLDFSNVADSCPGGFADRMDATLRTCQPNTTTNGCILADPFSTSGTRYSRVCGKITGYQLGTPEAFSRSIVISGLTIDSQYLDGVSLTHGSPRVHIWTFAAGVTVTRIDRFGCPCNTDTTATPPSFIGNDYFCESATADISSGTFYPNDPLWDGLGCTANEVPCCSLNNPPWFYKELAQSTFDDIEMRVCRDESFASEGSPLASVALYVRF